MSQNSKLKFQNWIEENNIPDSVKQFLTGKGYDTVDILPYVTVKMIDESDLFKNDKDFLKDILKLSEDSEEYNEEDYKKRNQLRWKEFGIEKFFKKWEKHYYPVELFSPNGYWAWNAAAKSLTYGKENTTAIWTKFDENKPGWMMSPPVLLPSELGAFKFTFNLRLIPNENEFAKIQMLLVNDGYNKKISELYKLPLKLCVVYNFIQLATGEKIGNPIKHDFNFNKLHDSKDIYIPENILVLRKPPIITVHVLKN